MEWMTVEMVLTRIIVIKLPVIFKRSSLVTVASVLMPSGGVMENWIVMMDLMKRSVVKLNTHDWNIDIFLTSGMH